MKRQIKKTLEQELIAIVTDRKASTFARLDASRILCGIAGTLLTETVIDKDVDLASSKLAIQWKSAKHDILTKTLKLKEQRRKQNARYRLRKRLKALAEQEQHPQQEKYEAELRRELEALVGKAKPQAEKQQPKEPAFDDTVQAMLDYIKSGNPAEPGRPAKLVLDYLDFSKRPVTATERDAFKQALRSARSSQRDEFGAFVENPDVFPNRESDLGRWVKRRRQAELGRQGE